MTMKLSQQNKYESVGQIYFHQGHQNIEAYSG